MVADKIGSATELYGLIGNPVNKSFSPIMQNTFAKTFGFDAVYLPFKVESGMVKTAVDGAKELGIKGFNVTVPHKVEVKSALAGISPEAEMIGAVNTLKLTENGYFGYNTDIIGLKKCFDIRNISIKDKTVVLGGAGGAARSAAVLAGMEGAKKLVIVNRTKENAEKLADRVKSFFPIETEVKGWDELMTIENPEIFIQTTTVGMSDESSTPVKNAEFFDNVKYAADIIYTPWETRLLKEAAEHGVQCFNGFDMLFYQGIASFEIWHDFKADEEKAEALKNELSEYYRGR